MNLLYNIINKIKLFINKLTTFLKYRNVLINKVILPNRNKTVMDNNLNHRLMTDFVHINNHLNADFPFKYLFDFINSIDETNICEAIVEKKDGKLTLFTIILIINEDIRYIGL